MSNPPQFSPQLIQQPKQTSHSLQFYNQRSLNSTPAKAPSRPTGEKKLDEKSQKRLQDYHFEEEEVMIVVWRFLVEQEKTDPNEVAEMLERTFGKRMNGKMLRKQYHKYRSKEWLRFKATEALRTCTEEDPRVKFILRWPHNKVYTAKRDYQAERDEIISKTSSAKSLLRLCMEGHGMVVIAELEKCCPKCCMNCNRDHWGMGDMLFLGLLPRCFFPTPNLGYVCVGGHGYIQGCDSTTCCPRCCPGCDQKVCSKESTRLVRGMISLKMIHTDGQNNSTCDVASGTAQVAATRRRANTPSQELESSVLGVSSASNSRIGMSFDSGQIINTRNSSPCPRVAKRTDQKEQCPTFTTKKKEEISLSERPPSTTGNEETIRMPSFLRISHHTPLSLADDLRLARDLASGNFDRTVYPGAKCTLWKGLGEGTFFCETCFEFGTNEILLADLLVEHERKRIKCSSYCRIVKGRYLVEHIDSRNDNSNDRWARLGTVHWHRECSQCTPVLTVKKM
ncbi:hypothetical protein EJ08DRAFT_726923 [Tothia fuscella]|uniref:Uncharacterized protein n=1 Tax=Tothia fuscella TaxID=1048955 RepID=A0A9P4U2Q0_9PEZI|nr:hypothetical protein EJ08DRAFT_726923 [Tothia fuscella]